MTYHKTNNPSSTPFLLVYCGHLRFRLRPLSLDHGSISDDFGRVTVTDRTTGWVSRPADNSGTCYSSSGNLPGHEADPVSPSLNVLGDHRKYRESEILTFWLPKNYPYGKVGRKSPLMYGEVQDTVNVKDDGRTYYYVQDFNCQVFSEMLINIKYNLNILSTWDSGRRGVKTILEIKGSRF